MLVISKIDELRSIRKAADSNTRWGFVPTMGYLHEGHLSLVQRARSENNRVAVSIYVNPTQFSPSEDLSSYPRDLDRDLDLLQKTGVDFVFTPSDEELYPKGFQTYVTVSKITQTLEGASRPTHFQGVTTIVAKLFNIVQPMRAYFGQKDGQQCAVVQQMIHDLNFDIEMIICPTVREEDGLAMSSRNKYLSAEERQAAPILFKALEAAQIAHINGEKDGQVLREIMTEMISAESLARIDYVSVADPITLVEADQIEGGGYYQRPSFLEKRVSLTIY